MADLAAAARTAAAAGRRAHSDLSVSESDLADWILARLDGDAAAADVEALHAGDLCLACACAAGDEAALERFERDVLPALHAPLARLRLGDPAIEEVLQILRHRLFVADAESAPKIASYSGRGPLTAWLRVVAVREALAILERQRREPVAFDDAAWEGIPAPQGDAALDALKRRYADAFKAAFREATAALSPRERVLLRHQHVDGLTMQEMARIFQVNRKTISRWLTSARETLLKTTRKILQKQLSVDRWELDSIMREVESQLDISMPSFLREPESA